MAREKGGRYQAHKTEDYDEAQRRKKLKKRGGNPILRALAFDY